VTSNPATRNKSELAEALSQCRGAFGSVMAFSGLINVLMLTGPLFMLQVYDRVLPSRSVPTLVGLAILMAALYSFQALLEAIRSRVLVRVGSYLDESLAPRIYDVVVRLPLRMRGGGDGTQPLRDLDHIRAFLSSGGPSALADLPWAPFYLAICFMFHWLIGVAAIIGGIILTIITLCAEVFSRGPIKAASGHQATRNSLLEASRRNAEVVRAMGMAQKLGNRWSKANSEHLKSQRLASDVSGGLGSLSKALRMLLQSLVLGLGAWLVINQEASGGVIIASSILVSRALAPVELAIANWKGFVSARQGWKRLTNMMAMLPVEEVPLELPTPAGTLVVEGIAAVPPSERRVVLSDISFDLKAGAGLGVIGPSASGKSSLARILVGVWPAARGKVRLDGAALEQWSPELLGTHIGYLPQDVELFDGTVADNIGRFDHQPDAEKVIAAAKAAGAHDLILSLPNGYDTPIGEGGTSLSAGQRQRVALARAMYGDPFLVVLDEPNSNLDDEGDRALTGAIANVRRRGGIVIVIAHRPSALAAVDQVLVLANGQKVKMGPKEEVLRAVLRPSAAPVAAE
jgi:PrtD family type I secretion system ABC transporter